MRRLVSWIFFILTVIILALDICAAIDGAIDVRDQLDALAERSAGGHELLGVGLDVLIIGILLISLVGLIISIISAKIGHCCFIKTISYAIMIAFGLILCSCFCIPYLF